jgi:hypothetical protein
VLRGVFQVIVGDKYVLNIPVGEPVIRIEWVSYLSDERIMEYYEGCHTASIPFAIAVTGNRIIYGHKEQ